MWCYIIKILFTFKRFRLFVRNLCLDLHLSNRFININNVREILTNTFHHLTFNYTNWMDFYKKLTIKGVDRIFVKLASKVHIFIWKLTIKFVGHCWIISKICNTIFFELWHFWELTIITNNKQLSSLCTYKKYICMKIKNF